MKILVTGAFGYFGSALVRKLANAYGNEVIAVGRTSPFTKLGDLPPNVKAFPATDIEDLKDWRLDVDAVIHLAGGGESGGIVSDPIRSLRRNVDTTLHVLANVRARRRILASSVYVYDASVDLGRPFNEDDDVNPDTLYGAHKATAELAWQAVGGIALRFAHIYGGDGIQFGRDGVTERMARLHGGRFTLYDGGAQKIDLLHINDACSAVAVALKVPTLPLAINIGGGAPVSLIELASHFDFKNTGVVVKGEKPKERLLDITLARQVLGWKPTVTLRSGLEALIESAKLAREQLAESVRLINEKESV